MRRISHPPGNWRRPFVLILLCITAGLAGCHSGRTGKDAIRDQGITKQAKVGTSHKSIIKALGEPNRTRRIDNEEMEYTYVCHETWFGLSSHGTKYKLILRFREGTVNFVDWSRLDY